MLNTHAALYEYMKTSYIRIRIVAPHTQNMPQKWSFELIVVPNLKNNVRKKYLYNTASSDLVLADILVRSPRKVCIFIIKYDVCRIKLSHKYLVQFYKQ